MPKDTRKTLMERAADFMDLPADTVAGLPRIEIIACKQFYLSNHKGLLHYDDNEIAINGGKVVVRIKGNNLVIKAMDIGDLMLEGVIFGIEFEYLGVAHAESS